jgi:hypothetical protein
MVPACSTSAFAHVLRRVISGGWCLRLADSTSVWLPGVGTHLSSGTNDGSTALKAATITLSTLMRAGLVGEA